MQKGQALILIIVGLLIIAVVAGGAYYLGRQTQQPTPTPLSSTTTTSRHEDPWQNYESGKNVDGIIINYPKGWIVKYRKEYALSSDYKAKYRIAFDFAPPDWKSPCDGNATYMCWGIIFFDVYSRETDINQWISKYSPDNKNDLTIKEDTKIGGKPTSQVYSSVSQFGATVIFGNDYTYDLSHSQDGSEDFSNDWNTKVGIFSYIKIN